MSELSFLLLDKPQGLTSFDALRPVKKILQSGKVGHCGTLDKFATGLLILLIGRSLKLSGYFMNCSKRYEGTICFGSLTDTLDNEGAVIKEAALPSISDVQAVLPSFLGSIMQTPPVYSALHINGKRASDIARSGQIPQINPRSITIYDLKLLDWTPPFAKITVHCSSGTYIRSLARDIGEKSGSCAHLKQLKRISIGDFLLDDAHKLEDIKDSASLNNALCRVTPEIFQKIGIDSIEVDEKTADAMIHGTPLNLLPALGNLRLKKVTGTISEKVTGTISVFCNGNFIALIEQRKLKLENDQNISDQYHLKYGFVGCSKSHLSVH